MRNKKGLIAPCGMNCGICLGYLREENRCSGCRSLGDDPRKAHVRCRIRNCEHLRTRRAGFCTGCPDFPCRRLKDLDRRYRTRYGMSMLENLESIKNNGIKKFTDSEKKRWACEKCGGTVCVHRGYCLECGPVAGRKTDPGRTKDKGLKKIREKGVENDRNRK